MRVVILALASGSFACAVACGGSAPPPSSPSLTSAISPSASFDQQASIGQELYGAQCASCHGANGEGKKGPRLVGVAAGALPLEPPSGRKYRKGEFHTAADVANFTVKNMPPDNPGSLTEDQYWAILAFDLKANGIDLGGKRLDASTAPMVVIHP
jgi:mono/diheme cytochrome c family protein